MSEKSIQRQRRRRQEKRTNASNAFPLLSLPSFALFSFLFD